MIFCALLTPSRRPNEYTEQSSNFCMTSYGSSSTQKVDTSQPATALTSAATKSIHATCYYAIAASGGYAKSLMILNRTWTARSGLRSASTPGLAMHSTLAATTTPPKNWERTPLVLTAWHPPQKSSPWCSAIKTAYQKGATGMSVYSLWAKHCRLAHSRKGLAPECMRVRSSPP
ncbi:MAG: hypothetical protein QG649_524 [Patescibacteria group bacterium]|nr:hypothetical protein [Patescibacteria group bacterium]